MGFPFQRDLACGPFPCPPWDQAGVRDRMPPASNEKHSNDPRERVTAEGHSVRWGGAVRQFPVLVATILVSSGCTRPMPSDAELETRFFQHRAALEELRGLVCASSQRVLISRRTSWTSSNHTPAEETRYQVLLAAIGAHGVFSDEGCSFQVPVWRLGRSRTRGFSYGPYCPKGVLVESLDALPTPHAKGYTCYVRNVGDGLDRLSAAMAVRGPSRNT
jgi:hypothetical protein